MVLFFKSRVKRFLKMCLGPLWRRVDALVDYRLRTTFENLSDRFDRTLLKSDGINLLEHWGQLRKELDEIHAATRQLAVDVRQTRALVHLEMSEKLTGFPARERVIQDDLSCRLPDDFEAACQSVCEVTGLGPHWFAGKKVLDAGCGCGRFSRVAAKLGAEVTAFDLAEEGVLHLLRTAAEMRLTVRAFLHNMLDPIDLPRSFDLVWCYGFAPQSTDICQAFQNLCPLVAEDGYLFLKLPSSPQSGTFDNSSNLPEFECSHRQMPVAEQFPQFGRRTALDEAGSTNSLAARGNDCLLLDELAGWLERQGFQDVGDTTQCPGWLRFARKQPACLAG